MSQFRESCPNIQLIIFDAPTFIKVILCWVLRVLAAVQYLGNRIIPIKTAQLYLGFSVKIFGCESCWLVFNPANFKPKGSAAVPIGFLMSINDCPQLVGMTEISG